MPIKEQKNPLIFLCPDGNVWRGQIERVSKGSYVWISVPVQGEIKVLLLWNKHWRKWNLIGGHWEREDGKDKEGNPQYKITALRELQEELLDIGFELKEESIKIEQIGLIKYIAYSERQSKWTEYHHALYKANLNKEGIKGLIKIVEKNPFAYLANKEELLKKKLEDCKPIANTVSLFIEAFPKILDVD